jgi:hypothetical protein
MFLTMTLHIGANKGTNVVTGVAINTLCYPTSDILFERLRLRRHSSLCWLFLFPYSLFYTTAKIMSSFVNLCQKNLFLLFVLLALIITFNFYLDLSTITIHNTRVLEYILDKYKGSRKSYIILSFQGFNGMALPSNPPLSSFKPPLSSSNPPPCGSKPPGSAPNRPGWAKPTPALWSLRRIR